MLKKILLVKPIKSWAICMLGLAVCACSSGPTADTDDQVLWADDKSDSAEQSLTEDQLAQAFDTQNPLACANASMNVPPASKADEANWKLLTTEDGHFMIYYYTSGPNQVLAAWLDLFPKDGHPDFVNEVAKGAEDGYHTYVETLGYPAPPSPTAISIQDLGEYFGYMSGVAVYLDNDSYAYKISRHFLRATAAHEYFHVIQSLIVPDWNGASTWFTEASAVWAEDQATGLFSGFVGSFIRDTLLLARLTTGISASLQDADHAYDSFPFVYFLVQRFQDAEVVKRVFELMSTGKNALGAVDAMLQERGSSFEAEFREYSCWNYLVGSRDDGQHYQDGSKFFHGLLSSSVAATHKDFPLDWQEPKNPPDITAVNYIEFEIPSGVGKFNLEVEVSFPQNWRLSTIEKSRSSGQWSIQHHEKSANATQLLTLTNAAELNRVVLVVEHLPEGDLLKGQPLGYRYRAFGE